jgi:hypothetical protein
LTSAGARLASVTARPAGRRMRNRVAVGAAVAVLCVISGAGAAQAQVAAPSAQVPAAAPGPGHPAHLASLPGVRVVNLHTQYLAHLRHVKVGKIAGIVRPRGWHNAAAAKAKTATCTEPACDVSWQGGPVQHHPQVFVDLWGPNWNTDPNQETTGAYLFNLYDGLGVAPQDTWSAITSQYQDSSGFPQFTGSVSPSEAAIVDTSTPPTGATEAQIAAEANTAGAYFASQGFTISNDTQIVVATQSGTCPAGFGAGPGNICSSNTGNYCAYHSDSSEPFINLPYQTDVGTFCFENAVNPGSAGTDDGFSIAGAHEYAETITDPVAGTGWIDASDPSGGEIADKCAIGESGNPPKGDVTLSTGTFAMQSLWSNAAGACLMASTEDTVFVVNPGNRGTGTGGTVNLQLTGFSTIGGTEFYATGLPTGLSISNSGLISGTATTAGTYDPVVYISDGTGATGSASFTWRVEPDTVTVTNPGNQTSYANAQVSLQLSGSSSDGFTPLTWGSADLPADLFINSAGLITGQVPHNSTYPITVTGTDTGGISGSASFTWTIKPDVGKPVKETSAGVCLNDNGSVTTAGNPVNISKCNGSGAQKWTFPSTGKLTVFGMCLADPKNGGTGTKLSLAKCSSATSDTWTHQANGEYVLKLNGLCLTDPNNSATKGTKVTITTCNAATSQIWTLP